MWFILMFVLATTLTALKIAGVVTISWWVIVAIAAFVPVLYTILISAVMYVAYKLLYR